ncbi:hypothetical protein [Streptomyces sp. MP131-18]|uniref:hypothetical protein n=1 Tax=Streptomyces sp. MP131-18 TaxID=1857892 RepID=UPI0009CA859A|nr:hypothetical protein [Streptomyces sp. MP131-18]ONK13638.1 hypothetical protein STBA_44080 [Streptomyces sp. MP131-18]
MWRNALGSVLAAIAAAAAIVSVFFNWYGGRDGQHIKWPSLFTGDGVTTGNANLFTGMFLPMLVAAALTAAGILLRSRLLMLLAGICALGFTVLWLVRQYQVNDSLIVGAGGIKWAVALPLAAGLVMLGSAAGMAGRHLRERGLAPAEGRRAHAGRGHRREAEPHRGGDVHQGPWPRDREEPREGERGRDVA